jgi:hypothetical protein
VVDKQSDLRQLGFFNALKIGMEYDQSLMSDRESIFHVFARTGFTEAIRLAMTGEEGEKERQCDTDENRFLTVQCHFFPFLRNSVLIGNV